MLMFCAFPWYERSSTLGIVLLALHFIFDPKLIQKIKRISLSPPFLLAFGFFLFNLLAMLWSNQPQAGWTSIEMKLSFIVLPILFSGENYLTRKSFQDILPYILLSLSTAVVYTTAYSFYHFHGQPLSVVVDRMNISQGIMHPGYFSNYLTFGLIALVYQAHFFQQKTIWYNYVFLFVLSIMLLLMLSKTALLCMGFFSLFWFWKLLHFVRRIMVRLAAFLIIIVGLLSLLFVLPAFQKRIHDTLYEQHSDLKNPLFHHSTESRMAAWSLEWELIKQHPITGYGTGEANALLLNEFRKKEYHDLIKYNMHTHSQVLRTWIDLGVFGVILLLSFWASISYHLVRERKYVGAWIAGLGFINLLTDDALEIQAIGVFMLFTLFLFFYSKNKHVASRPYY